MAVKKAKDATLEAKKKVDSAKAEYDSVKADAKLEPGAKKALENAKTDYEAKASTEKNIRTNAAKSKYKNEDYIPEDKEKHLYHVSLEKEVWEKGNKKSKDFVQKFNLANFKMFEQNNTGLGYEVRILWNPELYAL